MFSCCIRPPNSRIQTVHAICSLKLSFLFPSTLCIRLLLTWLEQWGARPPPLMASPSRSQNPAGERVPSEPGLAGCEGQKAAVSSEGDELGGPNSRTQESSSLGLGAGLWAVLPVGPSPCWSLWDGIILTPTPTSPPGCRPSLQQTIRGPTCTAGSQADWSLPCVLAL